MARKEQAVWDRFSKIYDRLINKDKTAYSEIIERIAHLLNPEDR